jgi:hypothetical protein
MRAYELFAVFAQIRIISIMLVTSGSESRWGLNLVRNHNHLVYDKIADNAVRIIAMQLFSQIYADNVIRVDPRFIRLCRINIRRKSAFSP